MKNLLKATLLVTVLSVSVSEPAYAQSIARETMTIEQATKRVFRLGTRGWRMFSLATSIGLSTVQAHADGADALETGQRIGTDIASEIVGTLGDAAYVATYGVVTIGGGVLSIIRNITD